ncbi:hypothetical protein G7B40_001380 [Aetokthonos hydrillicola Thurmond2011]|uniref:Uncharacterized protein n=1 Tax=Aetokthonos hydrillicola Thurmond2011 TaxID=2712845 RepID=A0AAP5M712_9CYAN|nr:hypothetical protein [Aetokthonos hydrillicola]MBO3463115.1 hypothetical protein [Aetokthonos hydrillicola CCALA 1050]MBW4591101.1 hypothetical protein [Aetokthonos hydrillicola CCALA 1050]MDR9893237.1 hypothetical protein [Aetokthonos hydrillicola Thurmond2011]
MKKVISSVVIGCLATFVPTSVFAATIVVASDGTFLGVVDNNLYNTNSICNQYGQYGSPYGMGIFNRYGRYGGEYSQIGAYNERAQKPPLLIKDGQPIAIVTKNPNFQYRLDPDYLQQMACRN